MSTTTLTAEHLTRIHPGRRGQRVVALDDVTITLASGRSVALVGPSGAGKSTLLNLLLGLDQPTRGHVLLDGERVIGRAAWLGLRRLVQVVPQDAHATLDPRRSIARQVAEPLARLGIPGDHDAMVAQALERVGLDEDFLGRRTHQLSGGQAQRVALARAVVSQPRILLADEPTSGLDLPLKHQVLELLSQLVGQGLGLGLVTHDLGAARALCDTVHVLDGGRIVEEGSIDHLFRCPQHRTTRELLAAIPRLME